MGSLTLQTLHYKNQSCFCVLEGQRLPQATKTLSPTLSHSLTLALTLTPSQGVQGHEEGVGGDGEE
jgi:hypothetical protein